MNRMKGIRNEITAAIVQVENEHRAQNRFQNRDVVLLVFLKSIYGDQMFKIKKFVVFADILGAKISAP